MQFLVALEVYDPVSPCIENTKHPMHLMQLRKS